MEGYSIQWLMAGLHVGPLDAAGAICKNLPTGSQPEINQCRCRWAREGVEPLQLAPAERRKSFHTV